MKIYFNVFMHSNKHLGGLCLGRVEALQSRRVLLNTLLSSVVFLLETVQSQTISLCHSKRMPYPTAVRRYNSAVAAVQHSYPLQIHTASPLSLLQMLDILW